MSLRIVARWYKVALFIKYLNSLAHNISAKKKKINNKFRSYNNLQYLHFYRTAIGLTAFETYLKVYFLYQSPPFYSSICLDPMSTSVFSLSAIQASPYIFFYVISIPRILQLRVRCVIKQGLFKLSSYESCAQIDHLLSLICILQQFSFFYPWYTYNNFCTQSPNCNGYRSNAHVHLSQLVTQSFCIYYPPTSQTCL